MRKKKLGKVLAWRTKEIANFTSHRRRSPLSAAGEEENKEDGGGRASSEEDKQGERKGLRV